MNRLRDGWYVVPYEVAWRDLDAMGHVNNAVFVSFLEIARTGYWLDLHGRTKAGDIGFIVARIECDYRRELNLGDAIEIAVRVGEMRGSSFDFLSEVRKDGEIVLTGKVTVVLYSWETRAKRPIPDDLRKKIHAFQGDQIS
ncbi:MAG: acyl-CoA thioesterase [Thermoanaerobaculia bacterium]